MKTCNKCGYYGALEDFPPDKRRSDGRQNYCRKCDNKISAARYQNNKSQAKKDMWSYDLMRLYNLSVEDYNLMLKKQNNCCAICGDHPESRLCVDHDHETNLNRGLLCKTCNLGLGKFKDNSLLLRMAALYLESYIES